MSKGRKVDKRRADRRRDDDDDGMRNMREGLRSLMYHPNDHQKRFICPHTLKNDFWTKHDVKDIKAFRNYDNDVFPEIKRRFLLVLSVLIFIEWNDLIRFNVVFVQAPEGDLDDENLVFNKAKLERSEMESGIDNFLEAQYIFKPEIIKRRPDGWIQPVEPQMRLPFLDTPEPIAEGGFATVSKRLIAPYCLRHESSNKVNEGVVAFAVKEFYSNIPERDFQREVERLQFLKKTLRRRQDHIMTHKAAIRQGKTFMILLPFVENDTLDVFLRGGFKEGESTTAERFRYNFSNKFPLLESDTTLHTALVKQAYLLADALLWLHHDLSEFGKPQIYIAHMDLKPHNILIKGDPLDKNTPAGTWMISDFGISGFHETSNEPTNEENGTILNVAARLTSRTPLDDAIRGRGPFQPPEMALERMRPKLRDQLRPDYRKCDVWSFGCILSEILAFALGKRGGVIHFRDIRYHGGDDNFYSFTTSPEGAISDITAENTKLKVSVTRWMDEISETYAGSWAPDFLEILRNASLRPCPSDRGDIRLIKKNLYQLYPRLESNPLRPASALLSTRPDASKATGVEALRKLPNLSTRTPQGPSEPNESSQSLPAQPGPGARLVANPQLLHPSLSVPGLNPNQAQYGQIQGSPDSTATSSTTRNTDSQETERATIAGLPSATSSIPPQTGLNNHQHIHVQDGDFSSYSTMTVPRIEGDDVKSAALDSTGERIAILSKTAVCISSTLEPSIKTQRLSIPSGVQWDRIRLAYPLLAIIGARRSNEILAELYDLRSEKKIQDIDGAYKGDTLSDICLSRAGTAACAYSDCARLYFLGYEIPYDLSISADGATVSRIAFDAHGRRLFLWLEGHRADYVYMFEPDPVNRTARHYPRLSFSRESVQRSLSTHHRIQIWPSTLAPFCIIYQNKAAFMAQMTSARPSAAETRSEILLSKDWIGTSCSAGLVYNNLLLCIEDHKFRRNQLIAYEIDLTRGDTWNINRKRHPLGKLDRKVDMSAGMAILDLGSRLELVLYRSDNKIERYSQEKARS